MDSLQEILGSRNFEPPDEINAIKDYIQRRYKSKSSVRLERNVIVLTVPNSSLAATIQLDRQRLIEACNIKKRLIIRYGKY